MNELKRVIYSVACLVYALLAVFGLLYSFAEYDGIPLLIIHLMVVWGMFFMSIVTFECLRGVHRDINRKHY